MFPRLRGTILGDHKDHTIWGGGGGFYSGFAVFMETTI